MKKLGILLLMAILMVGSAFAVQDPSINVVYVAESGLTVVTGTISGDDVENLPVSVYCTSNNVEFVAGTAVSDAQGLFSVVYDNNGAQVTCMAGDVVRSEIDNTLYKSRNVIVEDVGPYDFADTDIDVPEFGVLAGAMVLGLAGLFIFKRRN